MSNDNTPNGNGLEPNENMVFVKEYTNRWGKKMKASDYGKQAFVFSKKKKAKKTK